MLMSAVLGLLGFGSFSCGMYGVPSAHLTLDGCVKNENDEPLKDIQIVIARGWIGDDTFAYVKEWTDTIYTDSEGKYYKYSNKDDPTNKVRIIANDTTGFYASDSIDASITYKGGHQWYRGKASITRNFILKKDNRIKLSNLDIKEKTITPDSISLEDRCM